MTSPDNGSTSQSGVGEDQATLGHETWHPSSSTHTCRAASMDASHSTSSSPQVSLRKGLSSRKSSFNMKGMLKSVSTHHPFSRLRAGKYADSKNITALQCKGYLLEKQGKLRDAELMYSRHCLRSQKQHGKDSLSHARDLDLLVHLLHKEGKLEEAEPLCRRALEIKQKLLGEDDEQVATAMIDLGRVLDDKGMYEDALFYLKEGLAIRERVLDSGHPDTVSALAWVGEILTKQDMYSEALPIARKVLQAHEDQLGSDDIKVASAKNNLAVLLSHVGRTDEALPYFKSSHEIYSQHLGEHHPRAVATQLWIEQLSAPPRPARISRARTARPAASSPAVEANVQTNMNGDTHVLESRRRSGATTESPSPSSGL